MANNWRLFLGVLSQLGQTYWCRALWRVTMELLHVCMSPHAPPITPESELLLFCHWGKLQNYCSWILFQVLLIHLVIWLMCSSNQWGAEGRALMGLLFLPPQAKMPFDANKLYCSEVLAILLQNNDGEPCLLYLCQWGQNLGFSQITAALFCLQLPFAGLTLPHVLPCLHPLFLCSFCALSSCIDFVCWCISVRWL